MLSDEQRRQMKVRGEMRRTFQAFSDRALAFQSARIIGGIARVECDREIARRWGVRP